jgi:outer membrane protein TolC
MSIGYLTGRGMSRAIAWACLAAICAGTGWTRDLTLPQALDMAVQQSTRGRMVNGNLEVAQQTYFAKRINFYVPEISINGALPSYSLDESYRFFGGASEKSLYKTTSFGLQSFLQFKQNLITGGDLTLKANLTSGKDRYPNTSTGFFIDERSRQGYFNFSLQQPLLTPSTSKNDLHDRRDDLEIAKVTRQEQETQLRKDVIAAYIGMLQQKIKGEQAAAKLESARLKAATDSAKMADSILSEGDWLLSTSARLDAELDQSTADNDAVTRKRELTSILDLDMSEPIDLHEPDPPAPLTEADRGRITNLWENSLTVRKAYLQYQKADRAADFSAGSHGVQGNLSANYEVGRGKIRVEGEADNTINTNGWGVALNFSYPLWDGGASSATVKASRFSADQSRLEYERTQKGARSEIVQLLNQLDVSCRRLSIIKQQITVNEGKVRIADERFKDGQISRETFLTSEITLLEARLKYLTELSTFLTNKADLNGKLPGVWD